jgi:uncharacterized repeat protein (TIGR03803 family)
MELSNRGLGIMVAALTAPLLLGATDTQAQSAYDYTVIHAFDPLDGSNPYGALIQGSDRALYGTAAHGGANGCGTVFRLEIDGTGFTKLHDFDCVDGSQPYAGLLQASDGNLYGTTLRGGPQGYGTLFTVGPTGTGFMKLHEFDLANGIWPYSSVIEGADGLLYGTTIEGGANNWGVAFRILPDGTGFTKLHEFGQLGSDLEPHGRLIQASNGLLYGTCLGGFPNSLVFGMGTDGGGFTTVATLTNSGYAFPYAGVIQGSDGRLYGVGQGGGPAQGGVFGVGINGSAFAVLHTFGGTDGGDPMGDLIQGADGALYGTTSQSGANGNGVIFKINSDGSGFADIHDFAGADGAQPVAGMIQAADGAFYGTTLLGGLGNGTIFKLVAVGVSVADVSALEGDSGTTTAQFTVSLPAASLHTVTVQYATADGTATTASGDYVAALGTLTFNPGEVTKTVDVAVNGDTLYEADETFFLNLSSPQGAILVRGTGQATILNDDPPPSLSINSVSLPEGNSGFKKFTFLVSQSAAIGLASTVDYATQDGTATGVTGTNQDYIPASGTLTIPAGSASETITISVRGDTVVEDNETFFVNLSSPFHATIASGQGQGTIQNDDAPGQFHFGAANYVVSEKAGLATITVKRVNGLGGGATVAYATTNGTATGNQDYSPTSGTLTFGANQTTLTFKVPVTKDTVHEANETVLLSLSNAQPADQGAALGAQSTAVLTITDDDSAGKVQLSSAAYSVDATTGAKSLKVTVRRSGGLASGVTVHYATSDGTATDGADYTSTFGDLTFLSSGAAATTQTFTIPILQNTTEAKTFTVTLSSPMGGAVLGTPAVATVTILGADPTVAFSKSAYSVKTSQGAATISVKRMGDMAGTVRAQYATSPGTAVSGVDYTDVAGDLTFGPNIATRTFSVPIAKDSFVDSDKTVMLDITGWEWNGGSVVVDAVGGATLTITNPNATPTVQFSAATYMVNEATPKATITVKRTGDLAGTVTVDYATSDGTATSVGPNARYVPAIGTVTFGPHQTAKTFPISIVNDAIDEGTQTANLALANPTWKVGTTVVGTAVVGPVGTAVLSITDNEPTVQFSAPTYSVSEASKSLSVTVRRTGSATGTATVDYAVTGGSATDGIDYALLPAPGTLTFAAGQATKTIAIAITSDTVSEGNETVDLALSNATGGVQVGTPGTTIATIKDNDAAGKAQFSATDYSVDELEGTVTITVTRSGGTSSGATVGYATADGTAKAGTDYTGAVGTLTFGAGQKTATFPITVLDDGVANGGAVQTVVLTLGTTGGKLSLGTPTVATLWILKD